MDGYEDIYSYIRLGEYPANFTTDQKRILRSTRGFVYNYYLLLTIGEDVRIILELNEASYTAEKQVKK